MYDYNLILVVGVAILVVIVFVIPFQLLIIMPNATHMAHKKPGCYYNLKKQQKFNFERPVIFNCNSICQTFSPWKSFSGNVGT